MKFIKPNEISSKVMTLLDETDQFVIIVSPYVKISKWYKLRKKFDDLKSRNIPFDFIIRDDVSNQESISELNKLGFNYKAIPNLHAKLYLNEKFAIVSSMNMLLSSEINSIELAYQTETQEEYKELVNFCSRYLKYEFANKNIKEVSFESIDIHKELKKQLVKREVKYYSLKWEESALKINTGINTYTCFIWNAKSNHLRISGVLSGREYDYFVDKPEYLPEIEGVKVDIQKGGQGYYSTIWGTSIMDLQSENLANITNAEGKFIVDSIVSFIDKVDTFKTTYYLKV